MRLVTTATTAAVFPHSSGARRVISVDALRGVVMFTMIFVNDLAGAPERLVPAWMRHFHGRSGMTFVDLVFPAFLFIVWMSIPFALGSRFARGESLGKIIGHVVSRTLALLLIGIMMVNDESPDAQAQGWSPALWATLMYLGSMLAFCEVTSGAKKSGSAETSDAWRNVSRALRFVGFALLAFLAFSFRGAKGQKIISLSPFFIHTEWYGILGLIGWAYLVAATVFLCFRGHRIALLASAILLMCLYPADQTGAFQHFWLARYVGIGGTLGSQAAITVAGMLLGTILVAPDTTSVAARTRFTGWFIAGFAVAALLLHGLYGIYKNSATPSWCLWSCAITAALWLGFYHLCDVRQAGFVGRPLAAAGGNVLLAYLLSEMLPGALELTPLDAWYGRLADTSLAGAITRSAGCAFVILFVAVRLNRLGFRLKL